MRIEYLFPIYLLIGNAGAAIVYAAKHKYLLAAYWSCALGLNLCVFAISLNAMKVGR